MAVQSYRDLIAWQKAVDFVEHVYRVTAPFPASELYGLTSQMRRASVSIPSNIAEGSARPTADFQRFLSMSRGSLFELETQAIIANRLHFIGEPELRQTLNATDEVSRLTAGLIRSLG